MYKYGESFRSYVGASYLERDIMDFSDDLEDGEGLDNKTYRLINLLFTMQEEIDELRDRPEQTK